MVGWEDPHAPRKGVRLVRVRDVAGPWVLVEPEFGLPVRRLHWVLLSQLVPSMLSKPDPAQQARALLKRVGVLPLEEGDPELLPDLTSTRWLDCRVCKQPLHRFRPATGVTVKKWLYCPACDRMQRIP